MVCKDLVFLLDHETTWKMCRYWLSYEIVTTIEEDNYIISLEAHINIVIIM